MLTRGRAVALVNFQATDRHKQPTLPRAPLRSRASARRRAHLAVRCTTVLAIAVRAPTCKEFNSPWLLLPDDCLLFQFAVLYSMVFQFAVLALCQISAYMYCFNLPFCTYVCCCAGPRVVCVCVDRVSRNVEAHHANPQRQRGPTRKKTLHVRHPPRVCA